MTTTLDRRTNALVDAPEPVSPRTGVRPEQVHCSPSAAAPAVEVVVPVYNEAGELAERISTLHAFLTEAFPFTWLITIADNASTDETWPIAQRLADDLDGVQAIHLDSKGRGRALRKAWLSGNSSVVVYMDVDLSTDLNALLPLVAPLISGHSDLAIGSRLAKGARVRRIPKREIISRCYNALVHAALGARFTDAQCGFKAVRREVLEPLLSIVENDNWFFDTELLIVAERNGLRIHEVPVDWTDDPDSRVHVAATALEDLRGIASVRRRLRRGELDAAVDDDQRHEIPPLPLAVRVTRFAAIGAISTGLFALSYLLLRPYLDAPAANAISLATTTVINTALNRRFTFSASGNGRGLRDQIEAGVVFVAALALTTAAIWTVEVVWPDASRGVELAVLITASLVATVLRFVVLGAWVFRNRQSRTIRNSHTARKAESR